MVKSNIKTGCIMKIINVPCAENQKNRERQKGITRYATAASVGVGAASAPTVTAAAARIAGVPGN